MSMLKNVTIGQYYPGNSVVHRLDPRSKLFLSFAFILVLFLVKGFLAYLTFGLLVLLVTRAARVPLRLILRGLKPLTFIIALTVILHLLTTRGGVTLLSFGVIRIDSQGIVQAVFLASRLMLLVTATSLLTLTTSPIALTDGLERILRPGQRIGIPAHELAMMMTIALRFIPTLIEEADKIMRAQMARGADFETGGFLKRAKSLLPLLVPLFVSAFRRADELAMAMEARAYRGGQNRTRMKILRFTSLDAWAILLSGGAFLFAWRIGLYA